MVVTWVTQSPTNYTMVEYGPWTREGVQFSRRAVGYSTLYQDFGTERRKLYIHRVALQKLTPGTVYCECTTYRIGVASYSCLCIHHSSHRTRRIHRVVKRLIVTIECFFCSLSLWRSRSRLECGLLVQGASEQHELRPDVPHLRRYGQQERPGDRSTSGRSSKWRRRCSSTCWRSCLRYG